MNNMTTQRLMFHCLGTIVTWFDLEKSVIIWTNTDRPYKMGYERRCSLCRLTVQPIHLPQLAVIPFCSWRSGIIIAYLRTLSLEEKCVIEGIFHQETVFERQFIDTRHCMILCACGNGSTDRPQYQQQPAASSSAKVITVWEKGRYCTAAAYGAFSCHDTVQ